jgi:hypothetical protein
MRNGARFRARDANDGGWFEEANLVSVVAMAASLNVGIYLTRRDSIVPLAGVLGLAAVLRRRLVR